MEMKIDKKSISYSTILFTIIYIYLNMFSNKTYTQEEIFHLIGISLKSKTLLTLLFFFLSSIIIISLGIIIQNARIWFRDHNPITFTLSKYESYFNNGEYDKALSAINSKSIWRLFPLYKYLIHKLAATVYLIEGKEKLCYHHLLEADKHAQTDEQKNESAKIRVQLFLNSGSINAAKEILEKVKQNSPKSYSKTLSHFEALILEKDGNLKAVCNKLYAAAQLFGIENPKELFTIYNNLGRMAGLLGIHSEQITYYEKAKALVPTQAIKYQQHIVFQNLIGAYLQKGDALKYTSLFAEYSAIIDKTNKHDLLEYNNFLLQISRQTNIFPEFLNTIEQQHKNLYPLLTKDEVIAANIHELRFCFNNIGIPLDLLHKIENDFSLYDSKDLFEKLFVYQIIFRVITSPDGTMPLPPFEKLYKYILTSLRNSISEIDKYVQNEIEDFQVFKKCELLEKKVWLYNFQPYNPNNIFSIIQQKLKLIDEITDIYLRNGNIIRGIESRLNFVDECMHSLSNHLSSTHTEQLKDQMHVAFDKVEFEIQLYLIHPEIPPSLVRIAKYASFYDERDLTKKYRDAFLKFNINIKHFAQWIQNYLHDINKYLDS